MAEQKDVVDVVVTDKKEMSITEKVDALIAAFGDFEEQHKALQEEVQRLKAAFLTHNHTSLGFVQEPPQG